MVWDETLPSNATKIRNYPQVLTDNFTAIEQGDISLKHWQVNLIERNAVPGPIANDPTRADDTMIFYSKQDSSGETEAFIMDDRSPSANIIQLTQDGSMGSVNTSMFTSGIKFDTTLTYTQNNMVTAAGSVSSAGAGLGLFNCTTAGGSGEYTITFTNAMANTNYHVIATARMSGANHQRVACWRNKTVNAVEITIRRTDQSGSFEAEQFDFVIIGGR